MKLFIIIYRLMVHLSTLHWRCMSNFTPSVNIKCLWPEVLGRGISQDIPGPLCARELALDAFVETLSTDGHVIERRASEVQDGCSKSVRDEIERHLDDGEEGRQGIRRYGLDDLEDKAQEIVAL